MVKTVDEALTRLTYTRKKSAGMFNKLVRSALANAQVKDPVVEHTLLLKLCLLIKVRHYVVSVHVHAVWHIVLQRKHVT